MPITKSGMRKAGEYNERVRRLVRSVAKDGTTGQDKETFTPSELLWAKIDVGSGRKQRDYGAEQTGASATISIRNYYPLTALDRLYSLQWGETWIVETVHRGENEIICDCHRYDALDNTP